jgi:hypothetical protein
MNADFWMRVAIEEFRLADMIVEEAIAFRRARKLALKKAIERRDREENVFGDDDEG